MMTVMGNKKRSSRPITGTSASSKDGFSRSTGRLSTGLAGLSVNGMQEYQADGSTLSPESYAGASPASWSSHMPSLTYSSSSYSPAQINRQPSNTHSPQNHLGSVNSRTPSSSHGDGDLRLEYPSAPRVQLFHLERESSTYQPRIPRRTYTDSHVVAESINAVEAVDQEPLLQEAITSKEAVVFVNQTGSVIAGTLDGLVERLINSFGESLAFGFTCLGSKDTH